MNLTKGKIAKLYSKKRQSKKKYNKKRYRKNRTLRKTRGFNLAKRTLRHVKRGGQKTAEEIRRENGLCLSACHSKYPDEDSTEHEACNQECDDEEKRQEEELEQLVAEETPESDDDIEKIRKEMATALRIEKDKKIAQGLQTEYNTELLNEISQVSNDERLAQDLDEQQKLDEQRKRSDAELARKLTNPVLVEEHPLQDTSTTTADEQQQQPQQQQPQEPQLPATTHAINSVSAIASDSSVSGRLPDDLVPSGRLLDGDQDLIPNNAIASDDSLLPDPLQTPSVAAPVVVEQTIVPGPVVPAVIEETTDPGPVIPAVKVDPLVEPSAPPLSSTPPPPANEDKLSQAIDTIVDHLSTKIAERINLTQGTTSGQQNGFEAINAAALNSNGGRKPSRRLINRRRRNKSHKKKKQ